MNRIAARALSFVVPPLVLFALILLIWRAAVAVYELPPYLVPTPEQVGGSALEHAGALGGAMLQTAAAAICGLAASLVFGMLIALVFAQWRIVERSAYPYAIFLQTVPIVAIAPVVITWFGTGFVSIVVVSFIISLFPIITNATTGLTRVDENLLELFRMYNASRWKTLVKLRLPNSVPFLVTGIKISCGLSIIGAIVGEVFAGYGTDAFGLGYLIIRTSQRLETDYLFATVLASTGLGIVLFGAASLVGATILARWQGRAKAD